MRHLGMQVQEASRWGGPDKVLQKRSDAAGVSPTVWVGIRLIGITSFVAC